MPNRFILKLFFFTCIINNVSSYHHLKQKQKITKDLFNFNILYFIEIIFLKIICKVSLKYLKVR